MSPPSTFPSENDPRYEGWRVAGASAIGVFFVSILVYAFAVQLEPISREFGWSRQSLAAAYSLMAAASAVCSPWLGVLLDRYGPRRIAVPCVAVCGVGLASLSLLTASRAHLYGVFALMGVAGIGTTALAYSRAVSTWFDARRGFAIALVISGGALASMTHPPVTEALIRAAGWRTACLVLGSVGRRSCASALRAAPGPSIRTAPRPAPPCDRGSSGSCCW
jgi:predicted MFS family arabinose efflux permease